MEFKTGEIIAGRYRLLRCIESDGSSLRWLAADLTLGGAEVEVAVRPEVVPSSQADSRAQAPAGTADKVAAGPMQSAVPVQIIPVVKSPQIVSVMPQVLPIEAYPVAHHAMMPVAPSGPPIDRYPPPPKKVNDSKTEEELRLEKERRDKRRAEIERKRRSRRQQPGRRGAPVNATEAQTEYRKEQAKTATSRAMWVIGGIVAAIGALVVWKSFSTGGGDGGQNRELAHAPAKKIFSAEELKRFATFQGIEFGRVIEKTPEVGDTIVFGGAGNTVTGVSMDGKSFEVQLAEPVYKVFPKVRISLVDTAGGRRISTLNFEKNGDGITATKASKVVAKIASLMEKEYGIDMGDKETAINNVYFSRRYSDDLIDIRISTSVSPDSTSISFAIENRSVRMDEAVQK